MVEPSCSPMRSYAVPPMAPRGRARPRSFHPVLATLLATALALLVHPFARSAAAAQWDIPVAGEPTRIAAGDLNGDDHPDVVVCSAGDTALTFLMSTGPGTFGRTDLKLARRPYLVVIGDLDHAGPLDLVVTQNDTLAVFLGRNGDLPERMPNVVLEGSTYGVAILDADGDGDNDLAASIWNHQKIMTFLGNGDGTFGAGIASPILTGYRVWPRYLSAGSFDDDEHADLVVALSDEGPDGEALPMRGQGDGTFVYTQDLWAWYTDAPSWVSFATLVDGITDIVDVVPDYCTILGCTPNTALHATYGDGLGGFAGGCGGVSGLEPISGAVGDIDGNGLDEVAVVNLMANTVSLFSDGPGVFGAAPGFNKRLEVTVGLEPVAVAIADVDWNGVPDLLVSNYGSNTVTVITAFLPVGVEPRAPAAKLSLDRVRPNPARGHVAATLTLPQGAHARVRVLDGAGRLVRTLLDADLPAGERTVSWDGRSERGAVVAPGVYMLDARAGEARVSTRVLMLR